jgi:hypothetical protein
VVIRQLRSQWKKKEKSFSNFYKMAPNERNEQGLDCLHQISTSVKSCLLFFVNGNCKLKLGILSQEHCYGYSWLLYKCCKIIDTSLQVVIVLFATFEPIQKYFIYFFKYVGDLRPSHIIIHDSHSKWLKQSWVNSLLVLRIHAQIGTADLLISKICNNATPKWHDMFPKLPNKTSK